MADLTPTRELFLAAQLAGDRAAAVRIIGDAVAGGMAVPDVHLGIVQWTQRRIGELWEANEVSIAQEHVATAIAMLALSYLYPQLPRAPRNGRRVLLACVEGELHDMGPRIVSDFLEMAGYDVLYVGADVPTHDLLKMIKTEAPSMVALSATLSFHLPALREAVRRIREEVSPDLPLAVGGHAFQWSPGVLAQLPIQVHAADAKALVIALDDFFDGAAARRAG